MNRLLRPVAALVVLGVLLAGCTSGGADADRSAPVPERTTKTEPEPPAQEGSGPRLRYVALGDSFTAAPALPVTDPDDPCLRSSGNYPAQVATALGESYRVELRDRSCSGAVTADLAAPQVAGGGEVPPQLAGLDRRTDLVTLSMGGNDFSVFLRLVGGCVALAEQDPEGSPCADAAGNDAPLDDVAPEIEQRLVDAVATIRDRSPRAQVLLVGYPQLIPARGGCPELLPLATGDLAFAREGNRALSDLVARAADRAGAGYVDVWSASRGHDVCADEPWISGRGGDPSGAIPFHPLPAGQEAVARLVLAQVAG